MGVEGARLNRRRFLELTAGSAVAVAAFGSTPLVNGGSVSAQVADVPREKTMILVGTGGESPNQFTDIENVNPLLSGTGAISRSGYQTVYEPLWFYNMLTGAEQAWLAESYEYNAEFTEITVKLREGITWSDGTPMTSADVKYSFEIQRDTPGLSHHADMAQWIKEVTVTDDLNFTIVLTGANPRFFFEYCAYHADMGVFIVPAHIFSAQADVVAFTNYAADGSLPVVLGPYKLVATSAEQKIWDRRDDWWAATSGFHELPAPERLIFLPGFKEDKMSQMVIANEADITLNISPATMPTLWQQNPKIITHSGQDKPYGYTDWWPSGLGFNCTTAPWDNPEMRWAISYMIDRPQLVEFGYKGAGEPTMLPYPKYAPLMTYVDAAASLLETYPTNGFDLAKADEMLTALGYAKGDDGYYAKDGQTLKMVITTFDVFADIAPFLAEQLQKAGIDASFVLPPTFFTDLTTGAAEAYIWGHGGSVKDPYMTMQLYHQKFVKPNGESTYPFYRWANDEYDAVVDQMGQLGETDPGLMDLFLQGTEIWLKDLPDIPLLQFYHRIPMNETYWTNWPTAGNEYINGAFWHRTCLLIILGVKAAAA